MARPPASGGSISVRVELDNRCESCPDNCPYADMETDTYSVYGLNDNRRITSIRIECSHDMVCMFKRDNPHTQGV